MNHDYSTKELDEMISRIDQTVAALRGTPQAATANVESLIRIAEAAADHARSVRHGNSRDADFLKKLHLSMNPSYVRTPAAATSIAASMSGPEDAPPAVTTADGKVVPLGKLLGRGGEGRVYKIASMPGKVAKIYFPDRMKQDSELQKKITLMVQRKNAARIGTTLVAAIPEALLYDTNGSVVGYIMPQVSSTVKIFEVLREERRKTLFPDLDYRGMIAIAYNLAEVIDHLHRNGIVVGDMNQNNIIVQSDGTVVLVDCDSFDIWDEKTGKHYPCVFGLQELLAPELQSIGSLRNGAFTRESDNFSLAIHIFRMLMDNVDPFQAKIVHQTSSRTNIADNYAIINGECVFVRDVPGKERSHWAPPLEVLPREIQDLFRRVFNYTAATAREKIADRPTAAEWMQALRHFYEMPAHRIADFR